MKRRCLRERFAWHSIRRYAQKHRREHTEEEKDEAVRWFLIESGAVVCRCERWWKDATLDETARALGGTIIRSGEATLDVIPPLCALCPTVRCSGFAYPRRATEFVLSR
jgi:hypothetical protein